MGILLLTGLLALLAILTLIVLRGGAREPVTGQPATAHDGAIRDVSRIATSSTQQAEQLIRQLGFEIDRRDPDEGDGPGFVAIRASTTDRERIYLRAFDLPPGEYVRGPDVVAALDVAHSEGFHKTLLVSSNGFTDEAVLAARDTIAELIDDAKLDQILRGSA